MQNGFIYSNIKPLRTTITEMVCMLTKFDDKNKFFSGTILIFRPKTGIRYFRHFENLKTIPINYPFINLTKITIFCVGSRSRIKYLQDTYKQNIILINEEIIKKNQIQIRLDFSMSSFYSFKGNHSNYLKQLFIDRINVHGNNLLHNYSLMWGVKFLDFQNYLISLSNCSFEQKTLFLLLFDVLYEDKLFRTFNSILTTEIENMKQKVGLIPNQLSKNLFYKLSKKLSHKLSKKLSNKLFKNLPK